MDALTFQTKILLRGLNSKKEPIYEINYDDMLKELGLDYDEFVDLCILCGCDYTDSIEGIGPITAFKMIKEHKNIESVIEAVKYENEHGKRKKKYGIPENFLYEESRELFKNCMVQDPSEIDLKWEKPNEEELKQFLCQGKGFAESRVENGLKKYRSKDFKGVQMRLDQFFGKPTIIKKSNKKPSPKKKGPSNKKMTKK